MLIQTPALGPNLLPEGERGLEKHMALGLAHGTSHTQISSIPAFLLISLPPQKKKGGAGNGPAVKEYEIFQLTADQSQSQYQTVNSLPCIRQKKLD